MEGYEDQPGTYVVTKDLFVDSRASLWGEIDRQIRRMSGNPDAGGEEATGGPL